MDEKNFQKKESMVSVKSKIGVYYTTVDKWLRNYKQLDRSFFRKGHTYRTPAKKPLFRLPSLKKVFSGDMCRHKKFQMHRCSEDGLYEAAYRDKDRSGAIATKGRKTTFEERVEIVSILHKTFS